MTGEPLTRAQATRLLRRIVSGAGSVEFSVHAIEEMVADGIGRQEVVAVLAGGTISKAYQEPGKAGYRHKVGGKHHTVVVAFRAETHTVIVTAWRNK